MASVSTRPAIRLMSSLFCNTAVSLARNAQRSRENLATRRLSRRNGRTVNHVYLKTPLKHTNHPSVTLAANWHHNLLTSIPASLTFLPSLERLKIREPLLARLNSPSRSDIWTGSLAFTEHCNVLSARKQHEHTSKSKWYPCCQVLLQVWEILMKCNLLQIFVSIQADRKCTRMPITYTNSCPGMLLWRCPSSKQTCIKETLVIRC